LRARAKGHQYARRRCLTRAIANTIFLACQLFSEFIGSAERRRVDFHVCLSVQDDPLHEPDVVINHGQGAARKSSAIAIHRRDNGLLRVRPPGRSVRCHPYINGEKLNFGRVPGDNFAQPLEGFVESLQGIYIHWDNGDPDIHPVGAEAGQSVGEARPGRCDPQDPKRRPPLPYRLSAASSQRLKLP